MNFQKLMTGTSKGKLATAMCIEKSIMDASVTSLISDIVISYEFDYTGVYKYLHFYQIENFFF